jgi:hypothetical protein
MPGADLHLVRAVDFFLLVVVFVDRVDGGAWVDFKVKEDDEEEDPPKDSDRSLLTDVVPAVTEEEKERGRALPPAALFASFSSWL